MSQHDCNDPQSKSLHTPPDGLDLSRVHPACLNSTGIWVSPGKPTKEEIEWMVNNLPGVDQFRRHIAELCRKESDK